MTKIDQNIGVGTDPYHAGDDLKLNVTVTEDGSAKDLTNATVTWYLATHRDSPPTLTKDTDGDVSITDTVNGKVEVVIDGADTESLDDDTYYHELEVVDGNGNKSSVLEGDFVITDSQ